MSLRGNLKSFSFGSNGTGTIVSISGKGMLRFINFTAYDEYGTIGVTIDGQATEYITDSVYGLSRFVINGSQVAVLKTASGPYYYSTIAFNAPFANSLVITATSPSSGSLSGIIGYIFEI